MKPFERQEPWAVLGLEPGATADQVRRAYDRLSSQLAPGALALYSAAEAEEQLALQRKIRSAYLSMLHDLGGDDAEETAAPPEAEAEATAATEENGGAPPSVDAPTEFTGATLRALREARGLTLAEVASRTRIRRVLLEHLESESFAALPQRVFVRGFVMAYAHELGLDAARVWASYGARWEAGRTGG